jgi:hypothetical protein
MKSLLILGCSATKRPDAAPLAAIERYDGPLYRVLRGWMRETPDWRERVDVAVLSARFGLISGHSTVGDYDQRMTATRATGLRRAIEEDTLFYWPGPYTSVYISLGATYRLALPTPLPWPSQFARGGIGTRQAELKAWLGGLS